SKGVVYYASEYSKYLYALNANNGDLIWRSLLGTISYSSPCVANETVYIGSEFGYLHAINTNDGVRRWIFKADAEIRTTPCIEDSIIYFGCEDGYLYAVNIGEKKGFEDGRTSQQLPSPSLSAHPNPFRDRLTIETSDKARIYSITGQFITELNKGKHSIDTSRWREGIYIVKAGEETKRIVKIN
ncbi:MAG: PQQ-binding-like beta-propeller repeat protein, partial [Candidatus Coatesbacteria bacterium]|nr:PQQ-binding-like beta-propeller repeat protein [Candidatus Coatesbacteria bacterium]